MEAQPKPFVWQMVKEAVEVNGNKSTNTAIRDWVLEHYPGVNVNSILNAIIVCTVNHESRVHYKENNRPRRCNDLHDIFYRPASGKIEMYDPRIHGVWEIAQNDKGVLHVREVRERDELKGEQLTVGNGYIEAKHLRHYLAKNLELIEDGLELYVDIFGNDGVEYPTDFGPIDILCIDRNGVFVIIEILCEGVADACSGQLLKHRAWIKRHLAYGKSLRSYLVGSSIPENVRYSLADLDDVFLKEYDLSIRLKDVAKITDLEPVVSSIQTMQK